MKLKIVYLKAVFFLTFLKCNCYIVPVKYVHKNVLAYEYTSNLEVKCINENRISFSIYIRIGTYCVSDWLII